MEKRITRSKTLGVLALLLAGSAGSALADLDHVDMVFNGVVNTSATWAGPGETVYVSPYTATDTDTNPVTPITIYCLDWNHNIDFGQQWTADFLSLDPTNPDASELYYYNSTTAYQLDAGGNLDQVSENSTQMYDRYLEAAWLFTQIQNLGPLGAGNVTAQDELNVAAWTLFLDASPVAGSNPAGNTSTTEFAADIASTSPGFALAVYYDLQCAIAHVTGGTDTSNGCTKTAGAADFNGAGWYAVTPDPKNSPNQVTQEFLTDDPSFVPNVEPVPEPQAFALFGTLVGILGASRYRRQKRA
jgi:hypothetical protein